MTKGAEMSVLERYPNQARIGDETEKHFHIIAESLPDFQWLENATEKQNMREHWDTCYKVGNLKLKIEIKGEKKEKRGDSKFSKNILLEIRNGFNSPGWLYGKSDFIAFAWGKKFRLVETANMRGWLERVKKYQGWKTAPKGKAHRSPELYTFYHRISDGISRDDLFVWVDAKQLFTNDLFGEKKSDPYVYPNSYLEIPY